MHEGQSEETEKTIALAQSWARVRGDRKVGTKHILLALIFDEGLAGRALAARHVYIDPVVAANRRLDDIYEAAAFKTIRFTDDCMLMFKLAYSMAAEMGSQAVEPEHLLLALLAIDKADVGALKILESIGVGVEELRITAEQLIKAGHLTSRSGAPA